MTISSKTPRSLPVVLAAMALSVGFARASEIDVGGGGGLSAAVLAQLLPAAEDVKVYDRPSDDGTAFVVEWPKPDQEPDGVTYVIEVAQSDDFAGEVKKVEVEPSPDGLKSANPKYFGYSKENKSSYAVWITPAELFPPQMPESLAERLEQLHGEGEVADSALERAVKAIELKARSEQPGAGDLTEQQKNELAWLARLEAFVTEESENRLKRKCAEINAASYYVRLAVTDGGQAFYVSTDGEKAVFVAQARANLFKWYKLNSLLFAMIFSAAVLIFIEIARRNPNLFIRRIAGLEAVEEAIGRSTEMGRSVYFVHGLGGMGGMATIAAVNVLGRVARRSADYDTRVRVMNFDPIVTAVSQEVVQQAYTEAGRPDAFDADDVAYVAASQFSYAAAVAGRMVREQPAAIFLMGSFMAESLLLSESGAATGAIQVAGTDAYHQLPFFVTTCDYTLIGEELYAASAYLSREPRLLGSIRGQDAGKAFTMLVILTGVVALTIAVALGKGEHLSWIQDIFRVY